MDLQNIQDQLNTEFAKSKTRIIFWFDDKGEYEDEVSELQFGDVKLHILDGTNWLYSKYLLNEEDKESKYLVYAAFAKPSDAENPLADMYYYSTPYYTDRVSQMSQEIGIDNRFKEHLSHYGNFWKNKHRIEKFKELGIDHYNAQTIDIGLIAVLTDVKTPNFEEVVKQMMLGDNEKYFKALDDNGLTDKFWELCEKFFGYKSDKPNIDDLSACMILTYASTTLKATVPEAMRTYILKKRNDVVVFIRNIMDNVNYQDAYDKLVERIDKSLRFVTRIQDGLKKDVEKKKDSSLQMSDIFACDAFAGLDDIIIDWALERLNDEILDAQIDGLNIAQIADQRMSKAYHYSERYKNEYTTIKYAYLMMKSVSLMEFSSDIKTLVANYQKESYLIDSYYRWFYYAYDQIEDNSKFSDVRQRVENIYANTYLQKITPKWNENFTNDVMNATDLPKQEDFYKHYLRGYDGKQRVIVIISDAFRYECAKELFSRLELDEKCTPKMECMLSCLPSVTSVGMASLLPHKEMQVDGNLNVNVDGQACASMEQKDKILKSYNENNVALSFDEVANANQARIRELIQGKNIVYIYHNQVDARGDKPASENEVFNACAEAIEEIHKLVKKLTGYVSAPKFFITADHGFMRELRKDNYSNIAEKYFKLGNNLNQRDAIAVRKLISGFIKLIYPDGEVSKEEVAEIMDISLELRRRVKEQLKKIGGMEFYDVNFSYIDNDSFDEHFVSVPEQGGGKMIPEGMGKPGCLYTVSKSKTGMIGCYRLETQMMPGNGKLTCTGIGSGKEPKEATNTAFNYLKANGNAISGSISTTTKDYIINYQDMQGLGMTGNLALPTLIAISSAALSKPPISSLAVLGEISIGGTLIKVEDLASTLQVCLDSGAKKVLLPITSAADLGTVPSDLVGAFSLIFYSSPEEAVYKALGVE